MKFFLQVSGVFSSLLLFISGFQITSITINLNSSPGWQANEEALFNHLGTALIGFGCFTGPLLFGIAAGTEKEKRQENRRASNKNIYNLEVERVNEVTVKIESHEKAGLFVRVNRSFTAELREYLNEIRFPFAVNAAQFNDIQRMEEQDVIFFGTGVKRAAVWEVLCGFFDGIAQVQ